jgi:phosphatidylglycerophosphate synthase
MAGTQALFPPSLVSRVRDEGKKGEPVVVVRDVEIKRATQEAFEAEKSSTAGGVLTLETSAVSTLDLELIAVTEGFISVGAVQAQDGPNPLHAALERGLRLGQVRALPLDGDWYHEVRSASDEDVARAESTLLRSLKGGLEGFVDRYFNRKCSKWLTLGLLHTPLTPNGVTVLATLVGLLAAAAFALGGYAAGVIGALLFQLSAILDCCDGEVARLKFLESAFGEQLDVALDNVVHIGLYAGMAWAASQSGWGPFAWLLGGLATLGNLAAFVVVRKATRMKADLAPGPRHRVESLLNRLVSRDFSVIILALAIAGHVEWFLVMAAIGSNLFWPVLAWHLRSESPS